MSTKKKRVELNSISIKCVSQLSWASMQIEVTFYSWTTLGSLRALSAYLIADIFTIVPVLATSNGSIDTNGFSRWINIWYSEVEKISSGPWCLLMDNFGGHELNVNRDAASIVYLPPNSTSKHQPLELSLIAASKIRYRTALPDSTVEILQRYQISEPVFIINSGLGKWGWKKDSYLTLQIPSKCSTRHVL